MDGKEMEDAGGFFIGNGKLLAGGFSGEGEPLISVMSVTYWHLYSSSCQIELRGPPRAIGGRC
ncbi:hypothetical protein ACLOJK_026223 [Asimina triloba]